MRPFDLNRVETTYALSGAVPRGGCTACCAPPRFNFSLKTGRGSSSPPPPSAPLCVGGKAGRVHRLVKVASICLSVGSASMSLRRYLKRAPKLATTPDSKHQSAPG